MQESGADSFTDACSGTTPKLILLLLLLCCIACGAVMAAQASEKQSQGSCCHLQGPHPGVCQRVSITFNSRCMPPALGFLTGIEPGTVGEPLRVVLPD